MRRSVRMKVKFPAFSPINLKEETEEVNKLMNTLFHWKIVPKHDQPRKKFDEHALEELAASIKQCGILQPIVVRKIEQDKFQIIAGERRWRAAKLINLLEIPVIVKSDNAENLSVMTLVENIQRENLNPIELAEGLQELYEKYSLSHEKIGQMIGKNRATVTNFLRLLTLPEEILELLRNKEIEIGHARALLTLPIEQQLLLARKIVSQKLSARETERLVQSIKNEAPVANQATCDFEDKVHTWASKLTRSLSTKVSIKMANSGEGKVTIHVGSPDEVEWLINKLS